MRSAEELTTKVLNECLVKLVRLLAEFTNLFSVEQSWLSESIRNEAVSWNHCRHWQLDPNINFLDHDSFGATPTIAGVNSISLDGASIQNTVSAMLVSPFLTNYQD